MNYIKIYLLGSFVAILFIIAFTILTKQNDNDKRI